MYTVHIESTDNSWFGTGFMGIGIESMNDLKEAMFKYASNKGYWRPEIKLSLILQQLQLRLRRKVISNAKKTALLILLQQQLC